MMADYTQIDLHGLTVGEAISRLNDFLYDAFMADTSVVSINHGKGYGILRQAVYRELKKNSLVKSFRKGLKGEGGVGVTIVELIDH